MGSVSGITVARALTIESKLPQRVTSTTRPTGPSLYVGLEIYETDTKKFYVWTGTAWQLPWNMPWGVMDAVLKPSNQTGITTVVDVAGLTLTLTYVAGRMIRVKETHSEFFSTVAGDYGLINIKEGSTSIAFGRYRTGGASDGGGPGSTEALLSPTAGTHTYKVTAERISGTGTFIYNASASLIVEDLGPNAL